MIRLSLHCECGLGFWLVLVVIGGFLVFGVWFVGCLSRALIVCGVEMVWCS